MNTDIKLLCWIFADLDCILNLFLIIKDVVDSKEIL